MNDFMLREGGHISFSIRPSQQACGYGDALLKLSLEYALRSAWVGNGQLRRKKSICPEDY